MKKLSIDVLKQYQAENKLQWGPIGELLGSGIDAEDLILDERTDIMPEPYYSEYRLNSNPDRLLIRAIIRLEQRLAQTLLKDAPLLKKAI